MQEFDLIVIGGGPGGYLCAERAGKAGLRTALIEKRALGGTCLNEGCIPTKSLLYCAKQYQAALHGAEYGVTAQNVSIDHAQVVARKDGVVRTLVRGVGAAMKAHGVTVFAAEGRILGKTGERFEVAAGGETLSAPRLVLASGSSAVIPPIPGVREGLASGFVMTNRELLSLSEQPESLVCIGGGVIAVLNFFLMGLAVQKAASATDEGTARMKLKASYSQRFMMMILWVIVAIVAPCFQFVAGIAPLLFPGTGLKFVGIFHKAN